MLSADELTRESVRPREMQQRSSSSHRPMFACDFQPCASAWSRVRPFAKAASSISTCLVVRSVAVLNIGCQVHLAGRQLRSRLEGIQYGKNFKADLHVGRS